MESILSRDILSLYHTSTITKYVSDANLIVVCRTGKYLNLQGTHTYIQSHSPVITQIVKDHILNGNFMNEGGSIDLIQH